MNLEISKECCLETVGDSFPEFQGIECKCGLKFDIHWDRWGPDNDWDGSWFYEIEKIY